MVGILLGQIKGQDLASLKKKYPSSTPINKGRFHGLREEEIRGQSLTKTNLYSFFLFPTSSFPLSATTITSCIYQRQPPTNQLLPQQLYDR
jgi:hypothetical protein